MPVDNTPPETFLSCSQAAARLGVPAAWLKSEALAKRVPAIIAGRRILMNLELVERALLERAGQLMRAPMAIAGEAVS